MSLKKSIATTTTKKKIAIFRGNRSVHCKLRGDCVTSNVQMIMNNSFPIYLFFILSWALQQLVKAVGWMDLDGTILKRKRRSCLSCHERRGMDKYGRQTTYAIAWFPACFFPDEERLLFFFPANLLPLPTWIRRRTSASTAAAAAASAAARRFGARGPCRGTSRTRRRARRTRRRTTTRRRGASSGCVLRPAAAATATATTTTAAAAATRSARWTRPIWRKMWPRKEGGGAAATATATATTGSSPLPSPRSATKFFSHLISLLFFTWKKLLVWKKCVLPSKSSIF